MSSYDALGSVMAMPAGALVAGPVAAVAGVPATQYGAAALILAVSAAGPAARATSAAAGPFAGSTAPDPGCRIPRADDDQATSSPVPANAAHSAA